MASINYQRVPKENMVLLRTVCCVLFVSIQSAGSAGYCFHYDFLDPYSNRSIIALENENITIRFRLRVDNFNCQQTENKEVYIYISHPNKTHFHQQEFCILGVMGEAGCWPAVNNKNCQCNKIKEQSYIYAFTKVVTRDDSGSWTWESWEDTIQEAIVTFDIHYPPTITTLSITHSDVSDATNSVGTVDRGTNLRVTCAWEKGHPNLLKPDDVTLMDARGDPLNPVWTGDNNIRAAFRVDCERNGTITCYVPGASKNMTAGLQVTGCGGTTEPNNITEQNYGNSTPTDNSAVLIGGTTGAAAFFVIVVLSAVVLKKIWGKRTELPPPPAPCTMRHRATDSVLFRRNIPQQPQDRDTFGSDHTHFYFDIDDLETGTANSSQVSSDSTLHCQFLDFIACPSSDSSRSEIEFEAKDCESEDITTLDSLRCATSHPIPADPKQEASVPSCTDETATLPGETAKEGMTASRSSPSGMKPSPCPMVQGKPTPDDYLHPTASQSNAGTVPSERVASETSATLTTVSKETKKPPRLPSDYLHPTASPFEGNTAF